MIPFFVRGKYSRQIEETSDENSEDSSQRMQISKEKSVMKGNGVVRVTLSSKGGWDGYFIFNPCHRLLQLNSHFKFTLSSEAQVRRGPLVVITVGGSTKNN